jgi:hypothetical protein
LEEKMGMMAREGRWEKEEEEEERYQGWEDRGEHSGRLTRNILQGVSLEIAMRPLYPDPILGGDPVRVTHPAYSNLTSPPCLLCPPLLLVSASHRESNSRSPEVTHLESVKPIEREGARARATAIVRGRIRTRESRQSSGDALSASASGRRAVRPIPFVLLGILVLELVLPSTLSVMPPLCHIGKVDLILPPNRA